MLTVHAKNLGTAAVLSLQGKIVAGETEILRNVVDSLPQTSAVILDLAQATTVDAHGIGVMLQLRERMLEKGMRLELMNVNKRISRVFEIARLDSVFQISSAVEFFPAVARDYRWMAAA